jgi:uncharacterized protein YdhG (YjbR/CyaY superfamily)
MPGRKPQSVDEYLSAQPETVRNVLERVREVIRRALPRAEEVISYSIPAYRMPGGVVIFFAGWKEHFSLYPASDALVAELGDALSRYEISKGTIRFPISKIIPATLIARIAKLRAREVEQRMTAKAAAPKKKPAVPKRKAAAPRKKASAGARPVASRSRGGTRTRSTRRS